MMHMQRSTSLPGHSHHPPPSPSLFASHLFPDSPKPPSARPATLLYPVPLIPSLEPHALHRTEHQIFPRSNSGTFAESSPQVTKYKEPKPIGLRSAKGLPIPLLGDASQYSNDPFLDSGGESASTTLEELAHLVRLSTYQERKRSQSRLRLQRSLVSTALSARLARCGEVAHRTLVDNFRAEDKKSFAVLYNAIDDVKKSCDAMRRYSLLEPDLDIGRSRNGQDEDPGSFSTFMHEIPGRSRDTLLDLLSQIRTNSDFLPARISSLTSSELTALTAFHQESNESVLPFHSRTRGHTASSNRNSLHTPSPVERLLSFQRHDPLSTLIHTCFANSAGPDSAEDLRRTDIWASVCARLITDNKNGAESFISSVLNVWASMREWSGRSSMEWYLMKILEDGAFLLEKAEDQAGTRIHVEPRNAKDSIAADEFYDSAVNGLFEIVDDPGAGGIPEGLLELGNAIMRKLDPKIHNKTKTLLISKWLFSVFLLNAIIHPEAYGMMSQYHITEYGRQKILKEVAVRAMKPIVDYTLRKSTPIAPKIQAHIENIWKRFHSSDSAATVPKLLPARSITSLRETAEVHPYLVISPSDLVTIVNALFPERRPVSSALDRDTHFNGLRSAASSISGVSGISSPISMPATLRTYDSASIISTTESSFSDATSHAPTFDNESTNRYSSTSISSMSQGPRSEEEGSKYRLAIREMSHALGTEATIGSCHPCAEQWAVIFMNSTGENLSSQMLHDIDDDSDDEDDLSSSDSDMEYGPMEPDLGKDYHQLRDSILKLVAEFEIPQTLNDKPSQTFSNRTAVESPKKAHRGHKKSKTITIDQPHSRNPYRPQSQVLQPDDQHPSQENFRESLDSAGAQPTLLRMLEAAERQCQAQSDFVNAHIYWRTTQQLLHIEAPSLIKNGFASLLNISSRGPRASIRRSASAIDEYEAWTVWLKQSQERHDLTTELMMKQLKSLRDKMWYVADVRNSSPYDQAKNVTVALKTMGAPRKQRSGSQTGSRPRNITRSSANTFLAKTEAQVLDIMAAPDEYGGPNKLSDEQAYKTQQYLSSIGIENFCKGEERIHRFCLAAHDCVDKLVGEDLISAPDLWSSDLYSRDKRTFESGRQKGDIVLTGMGTLSISGEIDQQVDSGRRSLRGMGGPIGRPGLGDLRSISARNGSQQSFDSGRWSMSRASTTGDILDSQDYFGTASPVLTIDSATTFWSPFQTRVQSPSTSISSYRPGTASTSNETVITGAAENSGFVPKQEFLADLKKTLTTLLISDLGTYIFARGSETDSWFAGELGRECMDRRQRQDRKARRRSKRRVIEKKKSHGDLRSANKPDSESSDNKDFKGGKASDSMTDSTSTLDSSGFSGSRSQKEYTPQEFPYKASFRRLLRMFSVHPNPYAKLDALYDLEQLIIASLRPSNRRRSYKQDGFHQAKHESSFAANQSQPHSRFDEAVDSFRERRLSTIYQVSSPPPARPGHAMGQSPSTTSTDAIVEVLQDLFRDPSMLPKTLFRDLQFIAAFVPAHVLDKTDRGKAFWDAGLAALGLKQDVCRTIVEIADDIVLDYTRTRGAGGLPATAKEDDSYNGGSKDDEGEDEGPKHDMQDAAKMWTITAKEGDPVAERELAIFYLTHPELVERTTLPLTKPRETFKAMQGNGFGAGVGGWVSSGGWKGGASNDVGDKDRERSDPATMCVAYHWMELSALGGDELAKKYLRQREELNALP